MNNNEETIRVVEKATAIIFLNQQWIGTLADVLQANSLLSDSLKELVTHAKKENREAFQELSKYLK